MNGRPAKNLRAPRRPKCLPARFRLEELEARRVPAFDFAHAGNFGPLGSNNFGLGDLNGDGTRDVVTSQFGSNGSQINVLLGDGRGNFAPPTVLDSPGSKGGIRLGDVNRDGKLDLVSTGLFDGLLRTRFGNGDGTFGPESVRGQLAPGVGVAYLELADINGDGTLDAVGGSVFAGVRVALDDGTGTFAAGTIQYDGCGGLSDMAVIDATGDGQLDVVMATQAGPDLAVLTNLRSTPTLSGTNFGGGLDANSSFACARSGGGIVFAIMEHPISGSGDGRLFYGRNPAAPTDVFVAPMMVNNSLDPAIADFDNDGVPDLAFAARPTAGNPATSLYLLAGRPTGEPFAGTATTFAAGAGASGVLAADVNADGATDILIRQGSFSVYLSRQQSLVVSTAADENDGNARWSSGTGTSLREALAYAQTRVGPTTVTFAPFLANSTLALNSPIALEFVGGTLDPITVRNDYGSIALSGRGQNRVLAVGQFVNVALENLTITGGLGDGGRGAVSVALAGILTVSGCTFTGNDSGGGDGAALSADSAFGLTVRNSTFAGNTGGAAIRVDERPFTMLNSTVSGNAAGVRYTGANAGSDLVLSNNIIANNAGTDLALVVTAGSVSGSNNVVRTGTTAGLTGTINADPLLNPLANNGGRTPTMSLQSASPALDAAATLASVTADQRGVARPQFGTPDIGAFEARLSDLNLASVTTPDGASWFLFSSVGNDRRVYRQAPGQAAAWVDGGTASFIALQSDGSVVVRNSGGNVYVRSGSAGGVGTGWDQRPTVVAGDGATWFLGTEGAGPDRTIYRWGGDGTFAGTGGAGVTLGRLDGGSIVVRVASGDIYGRPGSNAGLGSSWELLNRVIAGDGAAWFAGVEFGGPNRAIYRWTGTGVPQFADGHALTLSVTPAGVVRATNAASETYQRIGSAAGLGSHWLRLTESLVVTTAADENDFTSSANLGTGTSLREALVYAEQHPGADTITFAPALVGQTVLLGTGWTGTADAAALRVGTDLTVRGLAAAPGVTIGIAPGVQKRHLLVESTGNLTLSHLTFTNGFAADFGGSIWNFGSLTVRDSTFTGNHAGTEGGAVQSWGGSQLLHVENSTIAGNNSGGVASAIATGAASNTWDHVTIVDNAAATGGGSVLVYQTTVALRNSIIARNTNDGTITNGNGSGTFAGSTNNLLGDGNWPGVTNGTAGNHLGVTAAQLDAGTLADNGGPTRTVALMPGSYAVNAGTALANLPFDQRGAGFPRAFGPAADIGAYELQSTPPPAPRVTGVAVNAGQANAEQRSRVTSLTVAFDAEVTFAGTVADAFTVSRIGGLSVGGFTATAAVVNGVTVVTLSGFTGAETEFGSLADGRYTVQVRADRVSVGGVRLDGNGDGLAGDDYALDGSVANGLYRLFGDADGSGVVNAADYAAFRPAFGASAGQSAYLDWLDIDGDGVINAFDYSRFVRRFGGSVP